MEDGQYSSEPVQTQFGWHVILREESREIDAADVRKRSRSDPLAVQQQKFQVYMDELRAAAE